MVARYKEPSNLKARQEALQLRPVGTNDPENPRAALEMVLMSQKGYRSFGKLNVEDIVALQVVADPKTKPK